MRHSLAAGALLLLAMHPLAAQHRGGLDLGVFTRTISSWPATYQASTASDDRIGGGVRIGLGVTDHFALEAEGSETYGALQTNAPACFGAALCTFTARNVHARGVGHGRILGNLEGLVGVGITHQGLRGTIAGNYWGTHAMAGLRLPVAGGVGLRVDVLHEWMPRGRGALSTSTNAIQAGLSIRFGKACQRKDDYLSVGPVDSRVTTGESLNLEGDAVTCGQADLVTYRLQGPGELDPYTGRYTATESGIATIMAMSTRGQLMTEVRVTVLEPAPEPIATPEVTLAEVTPLMEADTMPRFVFNVRGVFFRFDDSRLNQAGMDTLRLAAKTLLERQRIHVEVVGHTDHTGPAEYNLRLSKARAITVTTFLITEGVASERITTSWKGETEPIADNRTAAGRAMNRRVVIRQTN